MFNTMTKHESELDTTQGDQKHFQILLRVTFVFFLMIALIQSLLPRGKTLSVSTQDHRESVIDSARRMANTILPFVFIR
jgi:hypothetical protein